MACLIETTKDEQLMQTATTTRRHDATQTETTAINVDLETTKKKKHMKDDDDDDTNSRTCIVCWEQTTPTNADDDNSNTHRRTMLSCQHGACFDCISSWIQRCEVNGHDEATCPHCRQVIDGPVIDEILGRPYRRKPADTQEIAAAAVDDFTQTWLDDHDAQECPNCGMYQVREEDQDGDNVHATACLCGYIYCWNCQEGAEDCGCDHYEYYDYLVEDMLRMDDATDYPVASEEDLRDLAAFMKRRKAVIWGEEEDDENDSDDNTTTETETEVVEETAENFLVALFDEYTEMAEADFTSILEWPYTEMAEAEFTSIFEWPESEEVV